MSTIAANAQPEAPTSEETAKAAPASGTDVIQDEPLSGSGEAVTKLEIAQRDKPEDIQSTDEWLKNASTLNEKIVSEAKQDGEKPPVEAEVIPPVEEVVPSKTVEVAKPIAEVAAPAEEDELEPEVPGQPKKTPQHRIRANNPVDDMALSLFNASNRNGGTLTLTQATAEAERLIGKPAAKTETAPVPGAPRADGKPATIADTDAKIAELRTQRKQAFTVDADLEKSDALDEEIRQLSEHKRDLRDEANAASALQRDSFSSEAKSSQARAVEQFPDCAVKDSPLVKEMIALDAEWKEDGNVNFHSANKPFLLAQRASDRLKRAGVAKEIPPVVAASPQPVKTTRPVQPAPVAPGGSRTTQAAPQNGQLEEKLNKISNPAEYDAAMFEMTGKRY